MSNHSDIVHDTGFYWSRYKTAIVIMLLFTASNSVFFKLSTLPPMTFVSGRFLIASLAFLLIILIRRKGFAGIRMREMLVLLIIGCVFATGAFVYFLALKTTALASVLILNCCNAIFIVILSALILRQKIGYKVYLTTGITFCGILVIFLFTSHGGGHLFGNLMALTCALCAAIYIIFMKRFAHMDVYVKLFFVYFGSFLFATIVSVMQGNPFFCDDKGFGVEQLWMFCSAILSVTIPQIVINLSLRHVHATFVGNVSLMEPIVASIYGYMVWREGVTIYHIIGGILVIGGLLLYNKVESTSIRSRDSIQNKE